MVTGGAYLTDGTYSPGRRELPGKLRQKTDPRGRGPSETGRKQLAKGKLDPQAEIQQLILDAITGGQNVADPPLGGPTSMRGLNTMRNNTSPGGAELPPEVMAIIQQILGPAGGMPQQGMPPMPDGNDAEPDGDPDDMQ